ncbi:hypothetical protein LWI28_014886 [Acer negundo]|uniref:Uncharacterized protein n=1 Tax=Acer negundo TaxID=4023 RepID=A0AAD5J4U8_ACENE|nr:hypothetical protein LWI28_014886 [Acer negundo]
MRRADDPCNGLIHAMRISICYDTAPSSFNAIFFDYFGYWIKPIHLRGEIVFLPMIFPRPRAVLSPRASTQRRDMTTRPSTVTELAAVTFTDAQRKESPTPMSAQRAYSRAAESIALDSRDAYLSTSPVKSKISQLLDNDMRKTQRKGARSGTSGDWARKPSEGKGEVGRIGLLRQESKSGRLKRLYHNISSTMIESHSSRSGIGLSFCWSMCVQLARKAFLRLRAIGKGAEGRGIISRWKPCRRLFLEYLRESYVHSPIDVFGIVDLHATIRNDLARLGDNKLDLIFAFCPVSFHIPVFSRSPYFLKAAPFRPFLVGNPNHLLRQALLLFLHCFRLMAIMPLPALLTSSTRLPAQTQTHKPRLLFRVVFFRVLCSLQTPDSFIYSLGFSLVRLLISSSVVVDSLLPQHSSIGGVGKGHSTTGKDVDAIHFSSSEFKVEGLPDSPVFLPDSSVG